MEGLQKVLKTISNEMVEIKKQVDESSSKRPFRNFKRNQPENSQRPNIISNAESDLDNDEEEDTVLSAEEIEEEDIAECHEMWDFILPNSDNESEQESLPVNTRSKGIIEPNQSNQKRKNSNTITKEKILMKKAPISSPQTKPSSSNPPSSSKNLVVLDSMDYNIIEDMKKTQANISLHELSKLKHQQKLLLKDLNAVPSSPLPTSVLSKAAKGSGRPPLDKVDSTDAILIGDRSNSHTPNFLLTYEIYNRNLHNCLIDLGASSNIMPASVCSKLDIEPQKFAVHIVQLDRTKV